MSAANQSLTVSEIARKVLELLGPNGENWCQNSFGLDKDGLPSPIRDERTVKRCVAGAALYFRGFNSEFENALCGGIATGAWNDSNPFPVIKERLEMLAGMDELPR